MKRLSVAAVMIGAVVVMAASRARSPAPADDGGAGVAVVGLQIAKPLQPADRREQSLTGRKTGTVLTLRVTRAGKHFLGLDAKASKLTTFADDRGAALVDDAAKALKTWAEGPCWVSPTGQHCILDLLALQTPSAGASQIRLKAELILNCGLDGVTAERPDFRFEKDARLALVPGSPMTVADVRFDANATYVTFSMQKIPDNVAAVSFLGRDGKEIDMQELSRSVVGFMDETIYEITYGLRNRVQAATIRVKYFRRIEKLTVPVDIAVGIGL